MMSFMALCCEAHKVLLSKLYDSFLCAQKKDIKWIYSSLIENTEVTVTQSISASINGSANGAT